MNIDWILAVTTRRAITALPLRRKFLAIYRGCEADVDASMVWEASDREFWHEFCKDLYAI